MARYKIYIKPSAVKELETLPRRKDRRQVVGRIRQLANDPRPPGCQKLSGRNRYRIRQGCYRIVYSIEDDRLVAYLVKVGHRREVYRRRL